MAAAGLTLSTEDMTKVRMDVAFINQLADKRAFLWTQLLSDLEATVPVFVAIGSVKVNFQESIVSINGVAKDLTALNAFISNLQKHEAFRKAVLVNHHVHENENGEGGRPGRPQARTQTTKDIEFSLAAQYRLQTAGE
jgi:Tfp pilus assembly protein PilN